MACLLHDASEAYISDIIRPVKAYLPQYIEIESNIMDAIFQKYGLAFLSEEEHALWKQIDNDLLAHELIYFMSEKSDYDLPVLHTHHFFKNKNMKMFITCSSINLISLFKDIHKYLWVFFYINCIFLQQVR